MKCLVLVNFSQHIFFDIMKLKILFLLNCESPRHIAKLFSSVYYNAPTDYGVYDVLTCNIILSMILQWSDMSVNMAVILSSEVLIRVGPNTMAKFLASICEI